MLFFLVTMWYCVKFLLHSWFILSNSVMQCYFSNSTLRYISSISKSENLSRKGKNWKRLNCFHKIVHLRRGFQCIDIMTKTQRERMMKFANTRKGNLQFGLMMCLGMVSMTFYKFTNEWTTGGPIYIKRCIRLFNWLYYCTIIEYCIVDLVRKKCISYCHW